MRVWAGLQRKFAVYPGLLWRLGFVLFINVTGFSFIWPITTIYIHEHLGKPVTTAGVVLLIYSGVSSLGQLLGGWLFDRIGARRVILTGLIGAGAIIALPAFVRSWPVYVASMALFGFFQSLVFPAANALAARTWPEGGRQAFNFIYVLHNAGVALGTGLGGVVANQSFKLVFLSTTVITLLAAVFVLLAIHDSQAGQTAGGSQATAEAADAGRVPWVPIGAVLAGSLSLWLIYVQWTGTIAVHMQDVGISLPAYSLLWTLNGVMIVFGQPLLAYLLRYVSSLGSQLLLGAGLFLAAYGLLFMSDAYGIYVAAMVILTLGEMLVWPAMPAAIDQLAPASRRGFLQGTLGSAAAIGRMFGPVLGGVLYDRFGFEPLRSVLFWLLLIPAAAFLVYARTRRRVLPELQKMAA